MLLNLKISLYYPNASAVRNDSCAAVGPHDTAIISAANFFSLSLTASSMAISSKGFKACFTPSVKTPDLSDFT
jgi:hypothetical protein